MLELLSWHSVYCKKSHLHMPFFKALILLDGALLAKMQVFIV